MCDCQYATADAAKVQPASEPNRGIRGKVLTVSVRVPEGADVAELFGKVAALGGEIVSATYGDNFLY